MTLALPGVGFIPRGYVDSDNQWTPPWLVAEAVGFLGAVDTDPCWSRDSFVLAGLTYDGTCPEQDGLARPWVGNVWANVPYSNPTPWADRCAEHAGSGRGEVLLLVNVSTTVAWWRRWRPVRDDVAMQGKPCRASAVAFFDKRIAFYKNGVERKGNDREQMLVYWGARREEFAARFGRFAWVP